jgi:hypothetical protein
MSPRGENRENETNEAKFDENPIIIQNKVPVGVAANSGIDSELDSGQEHLGERRGKRGVDPGYSGIAAGGVCCARVSRPRTTARPKVSFLRSVVRERKRL